MQRLSHLRTAVLGLFLFAGCLAQPGNAVTPESETAAPERLAANADMRFVRAVREVIVDLTAATDPDFEVKR
ncbi:MAG: hypothetical protein ACE5E7_08095 [Anaerolineae bacterium]